MIPGAARSRIAPLVLGVMLLGGAGGCFYSVKTYSPDVVVRPAPDFRYEVEIRSRVEGRGNPHTGDFEAYAHDESDWLYLNSVEGRIEVAELIYTSHWRCTRGSWPWTGLRGHVEFAGGWLYVALEVPRYAKDQKTVVRYEPLRINGQYRISEVTSRPREPSPYDRRMSPCREQWAPTGGAGRAAPPLSRAA